MCTVQFLERAEPDQGFVVPCRPEGDASRRKTGRIKCKSVIGHYALQLSQVMVQ